MLTQNGAWNRRQGGEIQSNRGKKMEFQAARNHAPPIEVQLT